MNATLMFLQDTLAMLPSATPTSSDGLVEQLRKFIAPLFLFVISMVAISYLMKKQLTQFLQFAALAVGVAVLFYVPGIVEGLARLIAGTLGG